jgi:hypothetical protein
MTLFKITAHFGYKSQLSATYYVLAKDSTAAEKTVVSFRKEKGYSEVDFCHSETVAQSGECGKPSILLQ